MFLHPESRERPLLQINIPWMIKVIESIDHLSVIQGNTKLEDCWFMLFDAKSQLEALFFESIYRTHLRASRQHADELHKAISNVIEHHPRSDNNISDLQVWDIQQKKSQFRLVFLSELSTLPCFLVSPKESYDISCLIYNGTLMFPEALARKAPETEVDSKEAGKALAFELPTACGFHVFRVVESVLKRYWTEVSGGEQHPKLKTIGNYVSELEKKDFGDKRIWEALRQLAKLHRNPLIHPEVILTVEEAIGIIGMSRSVVGAMLSNLPDVLPTTNAP